MSNTRQKCLICPKWGVRLKSGSYESSVMGTITDILGKVGNSREIAHYLGVYEATDPHKRGVIKVSGACLQGESLEKIAEDLAHLQQVGFITTVTHGWGAELSTTLKESGIDTKFVNGDRYTDEKVIAEVVKIAKRKGDELKDAIEAKGG